MADLPEIGPLDIPPRAEIEAARRGAGEGARFGSAARPIKTMFAEIELPPSKTLDTTTPPFTFDPGAATERNARFRAMRQIGEYILGFEPDNIRVFVEQAEFMRDFVDDYEEQAAFTAYYPCYQSMGYRQLRTYFSWRSAVRNGYVSYVPASYAFVYVYELLNNIGVESATAGFGMLVDFWEAYRHYDSALDQYMPAWLKEYYAYYGLPRPFKELAEEYNLARLYPELYLYDSDEKTFGVYADISDYNIRASKFYTDDTAEMIISCFLFTLDKIRARCAEKSKRFERYAFFTHNRRNGWAPLKNAIFLQADEQSDRKITLCPGEWYTYTDGRWTGRYTVISSRSKQLVGYILKHMESHLRIQTGFKYKIAAPRMYGELGVIGVSLGNTIELAVAEFYTLRTRTPVVVDKDRLRRIRREANDTRDKLLVPEDEPAPLAKAATARPKTTLSPAQPAAAPLTGWDAFEASLTEHELRAIADALRGGDMNPAADEAGVMPQVLADGINQKAMDAIGDVILDFDGVPRIYDDYAEEARERFGAAPI
jgi:hypothetical protein